MMPQPTTTPDTAPPDRDRSIALALMGLGPLPARELGAKLAEAATWQASGRSHTGPAAILAALPAQPPARVMVEQVVSHGKAASVSGRLERGGKMRLFCHVIRYSRADCRQIAQLLSFEHELRT